MVPVEASSANLSSHDFPLFAFLFKVPYIRSHYLLRVLKLKTDKRPVDPKVQKDL